VASGTVRGLRDLGEVTTPPLHEAATVTVARSKLTYADDDAVGARTRSEVAVQVWVGAIGEELGVGHAASQAGSPL
jgi:hypothetical protein